jgi:D-alanine--poly(phosphoribitol) ligase subunit 1
MEGAHAALLGVFHAFAGAKSPAWRHVGGDLSFDGLHREACRLANRISGQWKGDRSPILILAHKDRRFPIAYWAALLLGRPIVPVESDAPAQSIVEIATHCAAGLLLVAMEQPPDLPSLPCPSLVVPPPSEHAAPVLVNTPRVEDRDVCYIMFSSGTTGSAKGIQISYGNLQDFVAWLATLRESLGTPAAVTGNVRHCFDVSLFELWLSWTTLTPLCALDHRNFADSASHIMRLQANRVGWWISTPSVIRFYLKAPQFSAATLPDLTVFLFCGEVLPKDTVSRIWERFPGARIYNTYGPTECTVAVTGVEITPAHLASDETIPIGLPRMGTWLQIAIDDCTRRGDGSGEIQICGRSVGLGYIGLPDRQIRAFPKANAYLTGDQGRVDPFGLWYFHGRLDREVKVQGVRIDLNAIESFIRSLPGVEDAVVDVFAIRGEARGLDAFVVGPTSKSDLATLASALAKRLPAAYLPRRWYGGLPQPLNLNGKLDRTRLRALAEASSMLHIHAGGEASP